MKRRRWVIKAGSQMVCSGGPLLVRAWMQQVAELAEHHNIEVVWVTSGAIATAVDKIAGAERFQKKTLAQKQALSAIGQPRVMDIYLMALSAEGHLGAQILLTYDDLKKSDRKRNFQNTVQTLLSWGVVPILNENDAVATEEIRFGDNDSLSAKVASAIGADRLIILTDVDGLFDRDPSKHKNAILVSHVKKISPSLLKSLRGGSKSQRGTGGMYSKVLAAKAAASAKIKTIVVRGDHPGVLVSLARGGVHGTQFG